MIKLSPAALGLKALTGADSAAPRSEVLLKREGTGKSVAGLVLEAAFKTEQGEYLLLTTDDTPFEEGLNIQLLDAQLDPLDAAVLGAAYKTGSFKLVRIERPAGVRFRFMGETDWTVEVFAKPRFRFPWMREATSVSRSFGLSRRFVVRGSPKRKR